MTDQINKAAAIEAEDGWLIHKAGRGWYRPNAQGYTHDPLEAGRYTRKLALWHSHPNGPDGPCDGMTIRHETEVKGALPLPPVRFTREDVEKVARRLATHLEGGREFDKMPPTRIELRKWSRERMCNINDATQEDAIEAATAALSAIGEVEHG